jgi:aspartate aminotransferase
LKNQDLAKLRRELRSVDSELVAILAHRDRLVTKIGELKKRLNLGAIDPAVEKVAIDNFVASAAEAGIDKTYARRVISLVIERSVEVQTRRRRGVTGRDSMLKQLSEMMLKAERKGRSLIRLDIGEPRFRTPRAVVREAKRYLDHTPMMLYGSSAGLPALVDAITERLNHQYGTKLGRSNILIFPGGRFAIFGSIFTTLSSLDRVALCQPAWPAYESCVAIAGGRTLAVHTRLEDHWDIDLTALEEKLRLDPKMIVLNNPNNPTGKVLSKNMFGEIMELARKYRAVVLSDEVYATYSSVPVPSVLEYPDTESIYVNSFSKEFSMTGWRVAYAVAGEERIARMRKIVETSLTNVPEVIQRAALAALKDTSTDAVTGRNRIRRRLSMACEELRRGDFEFHPPEGGFYVFPRMRRKGIDAEEFSKCLFEKYAVGVLPGTIFGEYPDFLRLAITEPEAAVRTGIRRIVKAMDEW